MKVNMIYARAANGVIGKEGTLPWPLPAAVPSRMPAAARQPEPAGRGV